MLAQATGTDKVEQVDGAKGFGVSFSAAHYRYWRDHVLKSPSRFPGSKASSASMVAIMSDGCQPRPTARGPNSQSKAPTSLCPKGDRRCWPRRRNPPCVAGPAGLSAQPVGRAG